VFTKEEVSAEERGIAAFFSMPWGRIFKLIRGGVKGSAELAGDLLGFAGKGWKVGDPINAPTKAGNYPSWSTVKKRYWKNKAASVEPGEFSPENMERMRQGNPPYHEGLLRKGIKVPMELHHIRGRNIPDPHNIKNLREVWPWEHSQIDRYRHYRGPIP